VCQVRCSRNPPLSVQHRNTSHARTHQFSTKRKNNITIKKQQKKLSNKNREIQRHQVKRKTQNEFFFPYQHGRSQKFVPSIVFALSNSISHYGSAPCSAVEAYDVIPLNNFSRTNCYNHDRKNRFKQRAKKLRLLTFNLLPRERQCVNVP